MFKASLWVLALLTVARPAHADPAEGVVAKVAAASEAFRAATEVEGTEDRQAAFRDAARLYETALDGLRGRDRLDPGSLPIAATDHGTVAALP